WVAETRPGGKPLVPSRKAPYSHWLAELHEEEKLYSAIRPLSTFILERISDLERHRDFFTQLREDGQVARLIGWFSESNHSAGLFDAEMLKKCGDIGLDIELSFYCPLERPGSPGA